MINGHEAPRSAAAELVEIEAWEVMPATRRHISKSARSTALQGYRRLVVLLQLHQTTQHFPQRQTGHLIAVATKDDLGAFARHLAATATPSRTMEFRSLTNSSLALGELMMS